MANFRTPAPFREPNHGEFETVLAGEGAGFEVAEVSAVGAGRGGGGARRLAFCAHRAPPSVAVLPPSVALPTPKGYCASSVSMGILTRFFRANSMASG